MQTAIAKIRNDNYLRHLDTNPAPCKDSESAYTEFVNTLQQLRVSAIYHDVSQHGINILEMPDTQLLDGPLKQEVKLGHTTPSNLKTNFWRTTP